jgi:hypothetical protein
MTNYPISLPIPDYLYDRARRVAEETSQPVEQVLLMRLEAALGPDLSSLPADEQSELGAMQHLSNPALWTIAREQMPQPRQHRMSALMDRNTMGTLAEGEDEELEQLVEDGQRLMLRKAQAMLLLKQRGHAITPSDMSPQGE